MLDQQHSHSSMHEQAGHLKDVADLQQNDMTDKIGNCQSCWTIRRPAESSDCDQRVITQVSIVGDMATGGSAVSKLHLYRSCPILQILLH